MWVLDIAVHDSIPRDAPIPEVPVVVSRMRVFLRAGEWKVGRSSGKCQIIVDQKSVSREQFRLHVYELEPEQVTDVTTVQRIELITEKVTTTQLDGVMLPMEQRFELKEGSRIVVGLKGAEIILHQEPMIFCTSSKYKKQPLMEALDRLKEAARALGAHVPNKWTDQMTHYVPEDPVMASVSVLHAIMLQKPLVSVKWVTEKLANFDVGTALPPYEATLPEYGGNFKFRKPLVDRSKLLQHIHLVAVWKEELLDVLVLAGVTISRAYELDDESFETENFLQATGEGRYCVALEPLENSVKKPHQKELVARRLKYLRTKGIRITNTSKVAGAIVHFEGLKAVENEYIGPSGEGGSQATGASLAPDQSIALAPSQTQDITQMPPPPPQAPRKAKPGPADQKKAARPQAEPKEQTGSQASQSTVVSPTPEKDKATKGRKAIMVDESPQESPAKVNGSGGSGKRRRSRGGKEEEDDVVIVEKEEDKGKGKEKAKGSASKAKRRRGEEQEEEQADVVVVVDGEEEEDKAGNTGRGKRRRQKEEEKEVKGTEEAEEAKANEPPLPSPSPPRPRRGKKAEEQKEESQEQGEEMEVDGPPPTTPMPTESPPPPASSGKKRKTPTPAKVDEKKGGKENGGVWGTGEKARSSQPVAAGQGGSQLSQASQSQRSRYSSRPRDAKRGEEQGWMMSQARVAWQANGGLGRLASQPSQTQPVHWPVSKEERRRAAAVEDLGPREEEEDDEEFPMGRSQYEARDLVVKPLFSQADTQLTPAGGMSQYDGSQFLPDFRRFRKNHVPRTSQGDVVTRERLSASAPKESEQQLRLADDEEEQREREREQEALFEEGGGGKAKPAKAGAAGGRRRKW